MFYFGKGFNTNHFNIWIPYVELSSFHYTIWVDDDEYVIPEKMISRVNKTPNLELIMGKDAISSGDRPIDGFLYLSHKKANYKNISKFKNAQHIYLGHGDSFKTETTGSPAILRYDVAFQAGYWVKSRFARPLRKQVNKKLLAIGASVYPGAAKYESATGILKAESLKALYAPTWEGFKATQNFSSLPAMEKILEDAKREIGLETSFRPHPTTGKREEGYSDFVSAIKLISRTSSGNKSVQFAECDFLISDVSGLTAEFLFTGKPIFMPWLSEYVSSGMTLEEMKSLHPFAYIWDVENQDFVKFLNESIAEDHLEPTRISSRKKYFRNINSLEEAVSIFEKALEVSTKELSWRRRRREFEKFVRINLLG